MFIKLSHYNIIMSFKEYCKRAKIDISETKEVVGTYDEIKDWVMDKQGYFLIKIDREANRVEVGFCPQLNKVTSLITGQKPQDIYFEACKRGLISRLDHAAYLGKELEKAFLALKYNLHYEQDEILDLNKKPEDQRVNTK